MTSEPASDAPASDAPVSTDPVSSDRASGDRASADGAAPGVGGWPDLPDPLPVPIADSHCHLNTVYDAERFGAGLTVSTALAHAKAVGVTRLVQVGYDLDSSRWGEAIANEHPEVVAAVALHPNEAPRLAASGDLDQAFDEIAALARNDPDNRIRAIGETGLDYFRTGPEGRAAQEESFRRHIDLAKQLDRTLVIHDRDAHDDVVRVLTTEGPPDRVVFHCFSGDVELARICNERGWFMSFAGPVTFKANESLREALLVADESLILVETDAPFLTPLPHRGRPNASYLLPLTMRHVAATRGVDVESAARMVAVATERAFGHW